MQEEDYRKFAMYQYVLRECLLEDGGGVQVWQWLGLFLREGFDL